MHSGSVGRDSTHLVLCGSLQSFNAHISLCSITGDVSFDYLINMMFARLLQYKFMVFSLIMFKYFEGGTLRLYKYPVSQ